MFSRNLYEIEEVAILLFQSIQKKRKTEANFWAHELYISLEIKLLKDILNFCALLFAPTFAIYNYTKYAKTPEDFEHMINVLCYCSNKQTRKDYKIVYVMSDLFDVEHTDTDSEISDKSEKSIEIKDKYETKKISFDISDYEEDAQEIFEYTIKNKQYIRCASLLKTFGVELFEIQKDFKQLMKEYSYIPKDIIINAISRFIINKDFIEYKEIPTYNWEKWSKIQGTKEARLIAINPICLKSWIDRPDKSIIIGNPMKIFENGSKYFKQFDLEKIEELEKKFYEIFKDDIPDEWSEDEIIKSHSESTINSKFNEFALIVHKYFE